MPAILMTFLRINLPKRRNCSVIFTIRLQKKITPPNFLASILLPPVIGVDAPALIVQIAQCDDRCVVAKFFSPVFETTFLRKVP